MAHFARLENNVVMEVILISNDVAGEVFTPEGEAAGVEICKSIYGEDTTWKQTSYNKNFRENFAGAGMLYSPEEDKFIYQEPVE